MWKIFHSLFGWDYIHWSNSADAGIARVHHGLDGRVYYWRYKSTGILDVVHKPNQVTWLSCKPEKYFNSGDLT